MTAAIILVLVGSFAHAGWNLLAKAGKDDTRAFALAYTLVVWLLCVVPSVWFVLSQGTAGLEVAAGLGVVSGVLHAIYAVTLQMAYTRADMSVVYPIARGLGPVVAVLGGIAFFSEPSQGIRWVGLVLVLVGVWLCSGGASAVSRAGLVHGSIVGVAIGAYTLWDQFAVGQQGVEPLSYYFFTVSFQLMVLTTVTGAGRGERLRKAISRAPWVVLGVGLLVPISYLLVLQAMTLAPLSVVAPLRATSVVIGAVGACLIYREPGIRRRLGAALVVTAGVALIGVG
jgi:drug/metabolite transporter (DMT)-like permease